MHNAAIYVRLSKEDFDKEVSTSIENQLLFIQNYIKEQKFNLVGQYIDDGYSGTNFNRPSFKKMLEDIDKKKINIVITKDLSRFGRDYIESGYYIEKYFPSKNVRYISILDGVDTKNESANNDIAPFKSLFNDMVSKDTSKKIKAILLSKKKQGLFLGSESPFGYKKAGNKHKLEIDEKTSHIVKEIFKMASHNKTLSEIANTLNNKKYQTPSSYKNKKNKTTKWSPSTVRNILTNEVYIGNMVQNKYPKINYKIKKRYQEKPVNYIVKENTHEAIIDKKTFNYIKEKMKQNRHLFREKKLFEGKIYCYECHAKLSISHSKKRNDFTIRCNNYTKSRKCTPHYLNYVKLERELIKVLKKELNIIENKPKNDFSFEQLVDTLISKIYVSKDKEIYIHLNIKSHNF